MLIKPEYNIRHVFLELLNDTVGSHQGAAGCFLFTFGELSYRPQKNSMTEKNAL